MSNTPDEVADVAAVAVGASEQESFPLSLHEFCARLSLADRRVELLGSFEHAERAAGRLKDTEAAYGARFETFANAPA